MDAMPAHVLELLDAAAERYAVPPELVRGVAYEESRGLQGATSRAGAVGVMQLMEDTAEQYGVDRHDTAQNIDGGVHMLSNLLREFDGDEERALAAYNWGIGRVKKAATWPSSVQGYVKRVLAYAEREVAPQPPFVSARSLAQAGRSLSSRPLLRGRPWFSFDDVGEA